MDRKKVLDWFTDVCESPATKIFHNAMYDVCWIRKFRYKNQWFNHRYYDCSSLIDENRFSLYT